MKIYQIGGCVRDAVLQNEPHDIDYIVVGATVEEMLSQGYKQVGKDFPVFLHPQTKDEYALARKEIKTGDKHTDFKFIFTPDITLEEDIQRRDFTINALARDVKTGKIVDLVDGMKDLEQGVIRHINSEHFGEDPLRVLRMCRFAAKLNFTIAPETMTLAREMVDSGMLAHLSPERIFKEIQKALETEHFETFIRVAKECGALKVILPEVDELWNIPEKPQYHPEGNSGEHTMLAIRHAEHLSPKVKFAVLMHDVGKIYTPKEILPAHHNHDSRGLSVIKEICSRLLIPNSYKKLALLGCAVHMKFHLLPQMKIGKKVDLIKLISSNFKDKEQMQDVIDICHSDVLGRGKEISIEEEKNFAECVKICQKTFEKIKDIHATDMPNFAQLPKDEKFLGLYREFLISQLRQNL